MLISGSSPGKRSENNVAHRAIRTNKYCETSVKEPHGFTKKCYERSHRPFAIFSGYFEYSPINHSVDFQ